LDEIIKVHLKMDVKPSIGQTKSQGASHAFESGADFKFYTSSANRTRNGVHQLDQELTDNELKEYNFDPNSDKLLAWDLKKVIILRGG